MYAQLIFPKFREINILSRHTVSINWSIQRMYTLLRRHVLFFKSCMSEKCPYQIVYVDLFISSPHCFISSPHIWFYLQIMYNLHVSFKETKTNFP